MSEQPQKKKPRIEKLELNREMVADLPEQEADRAKGGVAYIEGPPPPSNKFCGVNDGG